MRRAHSGVPDQELVCRDCGATFAFTEAEQAFFGAQGFTNPPKRCKGCRAKARSRGNGQGGGRPGSGGPGRNGHRGASAPAVHRSPEPGEPGGDLRSADASGGASSSGATGDGSAIATAPPVRPARPRGPMHTTTCSLCGTATEVPFVPDGVRPVFCLPCLKKQTR